MRIKLCGFIYLFINTAHCLEANDSLKTYDSQDSFPHSILSFPSIDSEEDVDFPIPPSPFWGEDDGYSSDSLMAVPESSKAKPANNNQYSSEATEEMGKLGFNFKINQISDQIEKQYKIKGIMETYESVYKYLHILIINAYDYYFRVIDEVFCKKDNPTELQNFKDLNVRVSGSQEQMVDLKVVNMEALNKKDPYANTTTFYECEGLVVKPILEFIQKKHHQLDMIAKTESLKEDDKSGLKNSGEEESKSQFQSAWYLLMVWRMIDRQILAVSQNYLDVLIEQSKSDSHKNAINEILQTAQSSVEEVKVLQANYAKWDQQSKDQEATAKKLKNDMEQKIKDYLLLLRKPNEPKSWGGWVYSISYKTWYWSHPRIDGVNSTINPRLKSEDVTWSYNRLGEAWGNMKMEMDISKFLSVDQY